MAIRRVLPTDTESTTSAPAAGAGASGSTQIGNVAVPDQYVRTIEQAAASNGIPASLLSALLYHESRFEPAVVSSAGAEGIAQFMPATAAGMGVNPHDPTQSIDGAAQLLGSYTRQFGSYADALAAYDAGAGAVEQLRRRAALRRDAGVRARRALPRRPLRRGGRGGLVTPAPVSTTTSLGGGPATVGPAEPPAPRHTPAETDEYWMTPQSLRSSGSSREVTAPHHPGGPHDGGTTTPALRRPTGHGPVPGSPAPPSDVSSNAGRGGGTSVAVVTCGVVSTRRHPQHRMYGGTGAPTLRVVQVVPAVRRARPGGAHAFRRHTRGG